jgi:hypothetical protein
MTGLNVQSDETFAISEKKNESASEKACKMDPYLEPHKEVIQARY